jgi:deoxyribonuclease V
VIPGPSTVSAARWPRTPAELVHVQGELAGARPARWSPGGSAPLVAACFAASSRTDGAGERCWAGAALLRGAGEVVATAVVRGVPGLAYAPGLLALREGPLLEAAVRGLGTGPDVLLVNASGRDHPRGAGLALHLGAVLDLPCVGVTDRPLLATGEPPGCDRGAASPLLLAGEEVARAVRTRARAKPLVVHAGWRTDLDTAVAVVLAACGRARTPEPLRAARRAARRARSVDEHSDR